MKRIVAYPQLFDMVAGETQLLVFHLKDERGRPFDVTGYRSIFSIAGVFDPPGLPRLVKPGVVDRDTVSVQFSAEDTANWRGGKYKYQLALSGDEGAEVPSLGYLFLRTNQYPSFFIGG